MCAWQVFMYFFTPFQYNDVQKTLTDKIFQQLFINVFARRSFVLPVLIAFIVAITELV